MRILTFLVAAVVLMSCTVPAFAADFSGVDAAWYQVLDFTNGDDPLKPADQEQENAFQVYSSDNATSWIRFQLPGSVPCYQVDMLVKVTNSSDKLLNVRIRNHQDQTASLNVDLITDGVYRVYGTTSPISSGPYFDVKFYLDDYGTFVTIQSFRILKSAWVSYATAANQYPWTLTTDDPYYSNQSGGNVNNLPYIYGYDGTLGEVYNYQLTLECLPFKKFDQMTMRVKVGGSINSINVGTSSFAVPFTVSAFTNSSVDGSSVFHGFYNSEDYAEEGEFTVTVEDFEYGNPVTFLDITIDTSVLAKTSSAPVITINGRYNSRFDCVFDVIACGGQVYFASNNSINYWLKTIGAQVSSGFALLADKLDNLIGNSSTADDFQNTMESQGKELDDLAGELDSVQKPDVDDIEVDLDGLVSIEDVNRNTSVLSSIMSNQIFLPMIMISLTLAFCAYALYGKR